ncbi:hypothetical protein [Demetria terragena]|uniref:hypothetical protein n=1 Tax=Demetria terragena TaxID=63959 RepID=UPI00036810B8|nr:hypothetical protein [Demetria terragena]
MTTDEHPPVDVEQRLASSPQLTFDTIFDEPVPTLQVPCTLTEGQRPEVKVVDRFTRGLAIVGRFALEPSLIGLKVTPGSTDAVRVLVQFSVDAVTDTWWSKRTPADTVRSDDATARMFVLRSQGKTRAAVALAAPDMTPDGPIRAQVEFDCEPGAVNPDGLLILEVLQPEGLPRWAARRVMPYAPVGVRIDKISLLEAQGEAPQVRPFVINHQDPTQWQILTLHPDAAGAAGSVRVRRHYRRPPDLLTRAARKAVREGRSRILRQNDSAHAMQEVVQGWLDRDELEVTAVALADGRPVSIEVRPGSGNGNRDHAFVRFHVADSGTGPVVVGLRHRDKAIADRPEVGHRLVTWEVTADWRG